MHIFYLQHVGNCFKVVAISTPRLPGTIELGQILTLDEVGRIAANGFQVVLQPLRPNVSEYFAGHKREIYIAPGYRVKRDTIPHQILPQPEPVQKTDKQSDKVETLRRPWYHFGIW